MMQLRMAREIGFELDPVEVANPSTGIGMDKAVQLAIIESSEGGVGEYESIGSNVVNEAGQRDFYGRIASRDHRVVYYPAWRLRRPRDWKVSDGCREKYGANERTGSGSQPPTWRSRGSQERVGCSIHRAHGCQAEALGGNSDYRRSTGACKRSFGPIGNGTDLASDAPRLRLVARELNQGDTA